jgi:hypothetical protein
MRHPDATRAAVKERLAKFLFELLEDARDDLRQNPMSAEAATRAILDLLAARGSHAGSTKH